MGVIPNNPFSDDEYNKSVRSKNEEMAKEWMIKNGINDKI